MCYSLDTGFSVLLPLQVQKEKQIESCRDLDTRKCVFTAPHITLISSVDC